MRGILYLVSILLGLARSAIACDVPTPDAVEARSQQKAPERGPRPHSPGEDIQGDPLPSGAAMRIGSVRFRNDEHMGGIAYSRDGRLLVTSHAAQGLLVWDARDGRMRRRIELGLDAIHDFAVTPDGSRVAVAGFVIDAEKGVWVQRLALLDLQTGREAIRSEGGDDHGIWRLTFTADGKTIAAINGDTLSFWDPSSAKKSRQVKVGEHQLWAIASCGDVSSPLVVVGGEQIHVYRVADGRVERMIKVEEGRFVGHLTSSPDGRTIAAVCGNEAAIRLWNAADGRLLGQLTGKNQLVRRFAFSPDGNHLAATGQQGHLSLWDLETGVETEPFATEGLAEGPLAFSPDGGTIAARGGKALHLWDRATGRDRLAMPEAHQESVQALAFLGGGKTLVSASDDRTVRLWNLDASRVPVGRQRMVFRHQGWTRVIAVSRNEQWLAVGQSYPEDGPVSLWHLPTGKLRRTFATPAEGLHPVGVRFAEEGTSLDVCWSDGSMRRWDTATTQERKAVHPAFPGPRGQFPGNFARSAVFSNDGRLMALLGNMGGGAHVADLETGKQLYELPGANVVAFSPDGSRLAILDHSRPRLRKLADGRTLNDLRFSDTTIHLADARTGRDVRAIEIRDSSLIEVIALSPDGKTLAVGPGWERRELRLYDVADGREVQSITTPPGSHGSLALAFTPDGTRIFSGMADTTILAWDVRRQP
jgi:WD40 repeat protein